VSLSLTLLALERLLRGRARYAGALARGEAVIPHQLHGWRAFVAALVPFALLAVVFAGPLVQLLVWSAESIGEGATTAKLATAAVTSLTLATVAALVAVVTATVIAYGRRTQPSRLGGISAALATLGYAVPGTVIAVAVYAPLAWVDRAARLARAHRHAIGLVIAYVVRFQALGLFAVDARMGGSTRRSTRRRARSGRPGADPRRRAPPLLWPGMTTAALLVFVEVMKELPATALLRPLGNDTLAVAVWEATKDSRFDTAALPALLIVLVGLAPVIALVRTTRAGVGAVAEAYEGPPPEPPGKP
jgi:iron(III) transport system permease protein